jgi:hypothetical protein
LEKEPDLEQQSPTVAATVEEAQQSAQATQSLVADLKQRISEVESIRISASELASSLQASLTEMQAWAATTRKEIDDAHALIADQSIQIQDTKEHTDKVRAELDSSQALAAQSATDAEDCKNRTQTAVAAATELLAEFKSKNASAKTEVEAISALLESAKTASAATTKLADRSDDIDERLSAYEAALGELRRKSEEQLQTITDLLPGATAVGLARAFNDRRKTFLDPVTRWQWLFVGSVSCLALLALTGLYSVYKENAVLPWDDLARLWIARLPIAAALIWLALHASRESALAKRLEEDYGYKAAIAESFLGFQRQMGGISVSESTDSPLSRLCQDTLATIGSPPGRIYDKHRLTVTPAGTFADMAANAGKRETPTG